MNLIKIAVVTPIFKSGDKGLLSNYRPISVLQCFSKILEKLMYKRTVRVLDKYNILSESQYGFCKKCSTNLAFMELDNNECTIGVFLDLLQAFDNVNHIILLHKLGHYGITGLGIALEWFKNLK